MYSNATTKIGLINFKCIFKSARLLRPWANVLLPICSQIKLVSCIQMTQIGSEADRPVLK